jgi:hypothetical protein
MRHIFGENERFWYLAMRIGAPFWHWMERSTNGPFWQAENPKADARCDVYECLLDEAAIRLIGSMTIPALIGTLPPVPNVIRFLLYFRSP